MRELLRAACFALLLGVPDVALAQKRSDEYCSTKADCSAGECEKSVCVVHTHMRSAGMVVGGIVLALIGGGLWATIFAGCWAGGRGNNNYSLDGCIAIAGTLTAVGIFGGSALAVYGAMQVPVSNDVSLSLTPGGVVGRF